MSYVPFGKMQIGRILRQVREQRHFDLDEVAAFAQISRARLADFEADDRSPSYLQLERLAEAYGIPPYLFASQTLPNLPEAPRDYRRAHPGPAQLTPAGMKRIWAAEKIARFTAQLAQATRHRTLRTQNVTSIQEPSAAAARSLRKTFDEWLTARRDKLKFTGPPEQEFLGALRLFFEVHGVVININNAPAKDFLGFYASETAFPLAFVNRSISSKKAQLFTLVHEFAHHVLNAQGISDPFAANNPVERQSNQFAAEFLAPMDAFAALVASLRTRVNDPSGLIRNVSKRSFLSNHAAAIRLTEAGFLSQAELREWERVTARNRRAEKDEEKEGESFGNPHAKRVSEVGYLPSFLAKKAIDQKIVDRIDVQEGLSLSISVQPKALALAERRFHIAQPR
jgi:Zn-dependent peptidase ImmA (M78 family)